MTPRGIAVVDVGSTNTKFLLFDADLTLLAEEKLPSVQNPGPPYTWLDPAPTIARAREVIGDFDARLPVDAIVPSAHGSGLALLDARGAPALPVMAYWSQVPEAVRAAYLPLAPPVDEVICPVNPMALTLALQLYWQETAFPDAFARVSTILPWAQYIAHLLGGRAVAEVTALGAQTQLWDVRGGRFSSLARARGWDVRFAPLARAWDVVGAMPGLRGRGEIRAGVHDSNANYLRYLADGRQGFTLLSTGTWIIGFDTGTDVALLDPARDTASNTDVFGRPVASGRFLGGGEIAALSGGAPAAAASVATARTLAARGTLALPSFSDTGGPLPGTGGRGRIVGPAPQDAGERASLAATYTALMTAEVLDALRSTGDVIVDGPFADNPVFCALLAAFRPGQRVHVSTLAEGTAAGAAVLGLMGPDGALPHRPVALARVTPAPGVEGLRARWQALALSPP